MHRGLTDTHKAVVAAAQHLVSQWWEKDCNKDVVALLALLDVQHCPGEILFMVLLCTMVAGAQ